MLGEREASWTAGALYRFCSPKPDGAWSGYLPIDDTVSCTKGLAR